MQHWIVDLDTVPLPSWLEAMPQARMLRRGQLGQLSFGQKAILWCRLRSGEDMDDVIGNVVERLRDIPLVVLCDEPDENLVVKALSLGAAGCCNTNAAPEVLRQVAVVVGNGGLWVGRTLLQHLVGSTTRILEGQSQRPPRDDWSMLLSEREAQVARLVASGASNKEIAARLLITERTVKAHLTAIFEKLSLRDRLQLSLRINGLPI